jgi:hypothetical protein
MVKKQQYLLLLVLSFAVLTTFTTAMTTTTTTSLFSTLLPVQAQQQETAAQQQTEQKNIQTRDQITVLLEGKSVNPNAHIHLYDTGSYHIMDGHVSVNIPCTENSEPSLEVMGGIAGAQYFMKPIDVHPVANMSMPGQTCMYHAEIASHMGENGWLYTDITLRNPSSEKITFPVDSVAIVGVNEIMKDPQNAPPAQGSMTLEERGGPGGSEGPDGGMSSNMTQMNG